MSFEEFQDGRHDGTILTILTLCVTYATHQVSAQSDLEFGRRCRLKNFKMAAMTAKLEQNDFSISEYLCHFHASHQVLAQSDLRNGSRCRLKNLLDIGMERC